MQPIEQYIYYREIAKTLIGIKVPEILGKNALGNSGKMLGLVQGERTLVFESENEMSYLMDFAINEYREDGKTAVEKYRDTIGGENEVEKEILEAACSSYTTLFKIDSISKEKNTLIIDDLFYVKGKIELTDIGFSQSATPELLLFTRIFPFKTFNMTSGISFIFARKSEDNIIKKYKKLYKRINLENKQTKRFIAFFKLNRADGLTVKLQ
ncbi:MAG: hypothetical protein FD167_1572 [bacterium]|nr:MAG: hypothetical protein FD167_1572 [bacterium]